MMHRTVWGKLVAASLQWQLMDGPQRELQLLRKGWLPHFHVVSYDAVVSEEVCGLP